jgi:hypothetical protein
MTYSQPFIVSFFLWTLLCVLLLLARPWRSAQWRPGLEVIAWRLMEFSVAVLFLLFGFALVVSILLATVWVNPSVPDTIAPTSSYLNLAIPLMPLGLLLIHQVRLRRRSTPPSP